MRRCMHGGPLAPAPALMDEPKCVRLGLFECICSACLCWCEHIMTRRAANVCVCTFRIEGESQMRALSSSSGRGGVAKSSTRDTRLMTDFMRTLYAALNVCSNGIGSV